MRSRSDPGGPGPATPSEFGGPASKPRAPAGAGRLFDLVHALELPAGDFAVFGSGPLVVRGIIRATNDLDVLCRGAAWDRAKQLGPLTYLAEFDVSVVALHQGAITLGDRWAIGDFDVDHLIDTAQVMGGLPYVRMEHVIAYKQLAGRPKDLEHLRLIDSYLKAAPQGIRD